MPNHAPRDSHSDPPGLRPHEPSGSQIYRGQTPAFMRRRPRRVSRCSVHVALRKPPQPMPDAMRAGVPERKIGFEAMEASAKLRKSSIDCLSAASFEAARSEQRRLPAEGPLKRRDGSSCKNTLNRWFRLSNRSQFYFGSGLAIAANSQILLPTHKRLPSRLVISHVGSHDAEPAPIVISHGLLPGAIPVCRPLKWQLDHFPWIPKLGGCDECGS